MSNGYIKLDRALFENPWISKDHDYLLVIVYLLKDAAYAEYRSVFNGETITLKPGQLITGRKKLAEETGVEEHKVQRVLNRLESEQLIEQQKSHKGSLITLLFGTSDSEGEQQNEQQMSNNRAASEQQVSTNKRNKKDKKINSKDDVSDDTSQKDEAVKLWNELPEPVPKVRVLTPKGKRDKKLKTLLAERGIDNYRAAVMNIRQSPFLLGKNSNWNITFDWFVELGNFDKVLEGNYLDRQQARAAPQAEEYSQEDYDRIMAAIGDKYDGW